MRIIGVSLLCTILLGAVVLGALHFTAAQHTTEQDPDMLQELAALRQELLAARDRIGFLEEAVDMLASRSADRGEPQSAIAVPAPQGGKDATVTTTTNPQAAPASEGEHEAPIPAVLRPESAAMREYVFSLIEEERRMQAEEKRRRAEEMRREMEELKKGPYDRFNVKVNSMAHVLAMDDRQRDQYYEISKASWDELQELRKNTKWQNTESRRRYKEMQDQIQKDFAADVESLLTDRQLETYRELSDWSRTITHLGRVTAPGDQENRVQLNVQVNDGNTLIQW